MKESCICPLCDIPIYENENHSCNGVNMSIDIECDYLYIQYQDKVKAIPLDIIKYEHHQRKINSKDAIYDKNRYLPVKKLKRRKKWNR